MNISVNTFPRGSRVPLLLILLFFGAAPLLPLPWNAAIIDRETDLQFFLRGDRALPDDFLFVFIGPEDVQDMGGWPVTRDYYGYLLYHLQQSQAKVVAFDILFETMKGRYEEFDHVLIELIGRSGNVCLPMAFGSLAAQSRSGFNNSPPLLTGRSAIWPAQPFRNTAAGSGFSNLGPASVVRTVPLLAEEEGASLVVPSFGTAIARLAAAAREPAQLSGNNQLLLKGAQECRVQLEGEARLRLNHFGGLEQVNHISFVDLLQRMDSGDTSINLAGKIVIVGVTAPGVPIVKATPFSETVPATLIHATVAENILFDRALKLAHPFLHWLTTLLLLAAALVIYLKLAHWSRLGAIAAVMFGLLMVSQFVFRNMDTSISLFYPLIAFFAASIFLWRNRQLVDAANLQSSESRLREAVVLREDELRLAQQQLSATETQLLDSSSQSDQLAQVARQRQQDILQLEKQLRDLKHVDLPDEANLPADYADIIYDPAGAFSEVILLIERVKDDDIPVLIQGETGTGKEMVARAIHRRSRRSAMPFVAVNCGALTESLLESELFGHEKGAFTGANMQRRGRFELAAGGTILLDEISETSPEFQSRLLRVLQDHRFERVGGEKTIEIDVRVIAACNRDLTEEIEKGRFRSDLYYRLNGFPIRLPSLIERKSDLPLLIRHFIDKHDYSDIDGFSEEAMAALDRHTWPGNVRELENAVRRAALLASAENRKMIRLTDLPESIVRANNAEDLTPDYLSLEVQILDALRSYQFSRSAITQTATSLGNRDRGTITEYFRGACFRALVESGYDFSAAAGIIAGGNDPKVIARLEKKMRAYVENLHPLPEIVLDPENAKSLAQFKGLPKTYHPFLIDLIAHLKRTGA